MHVVAETDLVPLTASSGKGLRETAWTRSRELPRAGRKPAMFKILELKGADSNAAEVGRAYPTRGDAMVALKKHLRSFKVSGHNREGNFWWARDAEGLRKCWIAVAE